MGKSASSLKMSTFASTPGNWVLRAAGGERRRCAAGLNGRGHVINCVTHSDRENFVRLIACSVRSRGRPFSRRRDWRFSARINPSDGSRNARARAKKRAVEKTLALRAGGVRSVAALVKFRRHVRRAASKRSGTLKAWANQRL